ncbi:MAG: tetratricopeptide repeat protein [Byssovorax sp.]
MSQETEWMMIGLDEKMARRQGIPQKLPVPKAEFEGLADKGLSIERVRAWIKDFLNNSEAGKSGVWRKQNSAVVGALEGFLDKMPIWEKAQKAFAERDYEKAVQYLKRVSTMDAEDHAAKLNLGSALANLGDHKGALKAFVAIRKTFEGDPDYHVGLGHIHMALKDKDAALDEMVLALEAKADCQPALDAMVQLGVLTPIYENPRDAASLMYVRTDAVVEYLTSQWDAEARDIAFLLEQLAYHEREQRHALVLAAAERIITMHAAEVGPERAELARIAALRSIGLIDGALGAAREYIAKLEKMGTLAPIPPAAAAGAQVELAKCLAAAGKVEEGNAAVNKALEIDPGDLNALMFRFWPADANDIKKIADATPALQAFAEAHPSVPGVWRSLARAYLATGRMDEALELFARAVALTPADDELRAEYWSELGKQQKYTEILADAAKITDMGKRDWKLRWNEAEAYTGLGKRMEARAAFSAINFDESLHVDIRKRAKRAVKSIDEAPPEIPGT